MPRASAAAAAATKRQILTSATELFASDGYADVSLDDVAQAANVTRGAIYHHYGSKIGLFRSVAAQLQSNIAAEVEAAAHEAGKEPHAQLRAGCHAFLDAITVGPAARVLLVDAPSVIGWDQWRKLDAENSAALLREVLAQAGVSASQLGAMTAQLSGAMNEAALWVGQQPENDTARQSAHQVLDRLLDAVAS
ncbi:TetR/AcrR family transcriptional regulator [Natronoglycomyces albus]|uniref:TetR/AcrR family transcriptional regulator n=1 Tax=Natronoglycomyces albus TaxID=2811108 RepID=A0A895XL76_9ACTN|nr:TetR/AcrR family transcriptional regulator [Natronoglycomyces albus]QSB06084.1 TetR/AcrR family transcriptional regulator [Natronoglycomyces albus]